MRVSAHALVRVFDTQRRLAVLGDVERYKHSGVCQLSPVGGFVEVTDEGYKSLAGNFKVPPRHFENGRQVRLLLNPKHLPQFEKWLKDGKGLEPNAIRLRFRKELADKHNILDKSDTETCAYRARSIQRYNGPASHVGRGEGIVTEHFLMIYDIKIPSAVLIKLTDAAAQPTSLLKFVTADEVKSGRSGACRIDPMCKYLLK